MTTADDGGERGRARRLTAADDALPVEAILARVTAARERHVAPAAAPEDGAAAAEPTDADDAPGATLERAEARWEREQLWKRATERGVPVGDPEVWRATLLPEWDLAYAGARAVAEAEQWVAAHRRPGYPDERFILALFGRPGTGKTVALARAVARHPRGALFVTATRLAMTLRNGYSENEAQWDTWERAPLLAIDELGRERANHEAILELICARYSAGRSTLLAGNLAAQCPRRADGPCGQCFLCRYVDDRVADRIVREQHKGLGLSWFAMLTGPSQRGGRDRGEG